MKPSIPAQHLRQFLLQKAASNPDLLTELTAWLEEYDQPETRTIRFQLSCWTQEQMEILCGNLKDIEGVPPITPNMIEDHRTDQDKEGAYIRGEHAEIHLFIDIINPSSSVFDGIELAGRESHMSYEITVGIGGRFYRQWDDCVWLTVSDADHPELPNWSSEALTPC